MDTQQPSPTTRIESRPVCFPYSPTFTTLRGYAENDGNLYLVITLKSLLFIIALLPKVIQRTEIRDHIHCSGRYKIPGM